MRPEHPIRKIVLTGPESTGKTALAQALAAALSEPWAPEFARDYVAALGRPYRRADLAHIARGQWLWEQWYAQRARRLLVCDTDWTVLHIWEHYRFAPDSPITLADTTHFHWRCGYPLPHPADLYLLCVPDFAWQPDALREHPLERETLFILYENLLQELGADYVVLRGSEAARLGVIRSELGVRDF